ncbi:MAG: PAS domain S-box protein [Kofleriaceae bacterium]
MLRVTERADELDQLLFAENSQPMFVFDRETLAFLAVNQSACVYYGWSRDELLAMTVRDIRPPEELGHFEGELATSPKLPVTKFMRLARHQTKEGRGLDVEIAITRITFAGRPAALAQVTERTPIHEAERRFRLMVKHSADGISVFDDNGIIRYVSPGAERMLGHASTDLVGQRSTVLTHPDDLASVSRPAPGATVRNLTRARHADGSWRWVETAMTNLTEDPAVRAYVANFRDVTDREQVLRNQLDVQRRLEHLLSETSAITYVAFAPGNCGVEYVSANVKQILGHDPDALRRDRTFWQRNIHPDDYPGVESSLGALFDRGERSIRYRVRRADGSYRWMQDTARVVRDAAGKQEIVGTWIDVTDRVDAELSLRRSEANFRTLIERSSTATLVHTIGLISYANPALVVMLGYETAEQLTGRSVLELVHPEDRDLVVQRTMETDQSGRCAPTEVRMLRRDGVVVTVEAEGLRLEFDGKPAHVVLGRDVSERRELFARIALADRMLSVGTLAAGVAHEINNPLAYVLANLELLASELPSILATDGRRSRLDPTEIAALVADAREGATRVSVIVRDLRALSRQDDGGSGAVDVVAVLRSSVKMAHNEIRHRARIVETYDQPLPAVRANASRLGQVFLNLLLNAAQAIAEGDVAANEIRIRAWTTGDGGRICVEVEDTGAGMSLGVQRRIFDPFFTTKPPGVGTGLGLSISHQIVTSFGGEIEVTSAPGDGSTFRVTLPIALEAAGPSTGHIVVDSHGSYARVLMIDDEAAVGRSTRLLLAPEHDVVPVTRAKDALGRLLAGERYDVILCDLMMPDMSGIEFYEQLARSAPQYIRKIVFLTGGAFTPHARAFLASVTSPHLEKPFTELALRQAIRRVRDL